MNAASSKIHQDQEALAHLPANSDGGGGGNKKRGLEEAKEKANGRPVYENVLLDIYLR